MYDYSKHDAIWQSGDWSAKLGRRCQFSGRKLGDVKGRYHPWARHHTSSAVYSGKEKLRPGFNYLLLSKRSHWFVHLLGGQLLLKEGNVRNQNRWAKKLPCTWIWKYPNPLQRMFHSWCRLPRLVKSFVRGAVGVVLWALAFLGCWLFLRIYLETGQTPIDLIVSILE